MSTAGNKGSSLSTPGTVRSTPSSEALDVVADLRYESLRYRSLPVSHKNGDTGSSGEPVSAYSKETNGNLFHDGPITLPSLEYTPKQYQTPPVTLNGNANTATAQNVEDLYAKVSLFFFNCVILVLSLIHI